MKAYQKKAIGAILTAIFCFSPVSAFAAEGLTITSGLTLESEEAECTFDESRILYGEAAPYSNIAISVSQEDAAGELQEIYSDEVAVGSLGLFSASFPLEMGCNYITLEVVQENAAEEEKIEAVIKRVSCDLKTQLKKMIALPGLPEVF